MKRLILSLSLLSFVVLSSKSQHLQVQGRHIFTPCGDTVVLRGLNKMSIWQDIDGDPSMAEMAQSGANCIRIVWGATGLGRSSGAQGSAEQLDEIMENCIAQGMIPIPEAHDATGDGWKYMDKVVDWWVSPEVVRVLKKHEAYSIINIANEAGESVPDSAWVATYKSAITRFREAGLKAPLMIDPDGWGQNIDKCQKFGKELLDHDPEHNLIFSVHMWWPTEWNGGLENTIKRIKTEIEESVAMELPLVIGEFARHAPGCVLEIPYGNIMAECHKNKIGWMAWSWGPGNGDCREMDMTEDGSFATLRRGTWASEVVFGVFGLRKTSVKLPYITHRGECPPYCQVPSLPSSNILCSGDLMLDASLPTKGRTFQWLKDGVPMQGEIKSVLKVNTPGNYTVVVDSGACVKKAECRVTNEVPSFRIDGELNLCAKQYSYVTVEPRDQGFSVEWFQGKQLISSGDEIRVSKGGEYSARLVKKGCQSQELSFTVEAPSFTVKPVCVRFPGEVFLKAKGGSGKFEWYDNASMTNVVGQGKVLGVDVSKTTRFYVRDIGEEKYKNCAPKVVEVIVGDCK